jgi:LPS-assembly protein
MSAKLDPQGNVRRFVRPLATLAFAALAAVSLADEELQEPPPQTPPQTPPTATPPQTPPAAPQQPPLTEKPTLQPSGFPGLPERDGRLPEGQEGVSQEIRILKGNVSRQGNLLKARDGVHIQYRGYDIFAREVDGDLDTDIFTLRGDGQLIGKDAVVRGETVEVNFRTDTFRAFKTAAEVRPEFLQGRTLDNVYLTGEEAWGSEREIFAHDCGLTTCNYDKPHYLLDSRFVNLRPNKRIILRNTRIEILGKTILTIPYLSIPLDTRRTRYTPEVGRTPEEGYFIKTRWGIPLRGPNTLDANLDWFEKRGFGIGGLFRYSAVRHDGYLRAYGLLGDDDTVEVQQGHRLLWGNSLFQIENNYQQRNFLNAPQNTIFTTRASLTIPQGRNNTRLSFYRNNNKSSTFESTSQTIALSDTRSIGERFRSQFDVSWVRSESQFSTGGSEREQVDLRFKGQHDFRSALAELEYQRSIPVGETSNFFSASDKTPVLTLKSDHRRLFGNNFKIPFFAEFSVGEFVDPREKERISRTNFDLRSNYEYGANKPFSIRLDGRFKQSLYSDDTAQFAVGYGAHAKYELGHDTSLNVRYNYLEPEGFTPLTLDRIGRINLATTDLSYRPVRTLLVGLQTGYDFRAEQRGEAVSWQQIGLRAEWTPKSWFMLRALPYYDPISQRWSSVRLDLTYLPGATFISVGARYDGFRQVWGATNVFVDGLKWGRTMLSALFSYNGYLKKFEETHYSLTYDLHCAEAILQVRESNVGFRTGREVYFFIRIKAFPFDTPFGLSRRGAPIGTATGR